MFSYVTTIVLTNSKTNKAVAMKGLTLGLLHLHFEFRFGQHFCVRAKILCSGENFGFGRKGSVQWAFFVQILP